MLSIDFVAEFHIKFRVHYNNAVIPYGKKILDH